MKKKRKINILHIILLPNRKWPKRHEAVRRPSHSRSIRWVVAPSTSLSNCRRRDIPFRRAIPCTALRRTDGMRRSALQRVTCTVCVSYNAALLLINYVVPLAVLALTYSLVGRRLWGNQAIGERLPGQAETVRSKRRVRGKLCVCRQCVRVRNRARACVCVRLTW